MSARAPRLQAWEEAAEWPMAALAVLFLAVFATEVLAQGLSPGWHRALVISDYTIWAIFFVWLIDGAARGFTGVPGRVLELRPLLYLGQISYGLYVFHPLMISLARWGFSRLEQPYPENPAVMFVFLVAGTIALAALSWHFYEKPLNDLKRRFDFRFATAEHEVATDIPDLGSTLEHLR